MATLLSTDHIVARNFVATRLYEANLLGRLHARGMCHDMSLVNSMNCMEGRTELYSSMSAGALWVGVGACGPTLRRRAVTRVQSDQAAAQLSSPEL